MGATRGGGGSSYGKKVIYNRVLQMVRRCFPVAIPEGKLCCAVVEQAISDVYLSPWSNDGIGYKGAWEYLTGSMPHAEICGVEAEYIRRVLVQSGLEEFAGLAARNEPVERLAYG